MADALARWRGGAVCAHACGLARSAGALRPIRRWPARRLIRRCGSMGGLLHEYVLPHDPAAAMEVSLRIQTNQPGRRMLSHLRLTP